MKKIVLGKGLDALIPADRGDAAERRLRTVPLDRIAPNPMQPRRDFDDTSLLELADSIARNGIMQPIVVRQDGPMYTIIAGERRFRAARLADLEEIPVIVLDEVDDNRMLELALVENLQREDLNPVETAEAYRSLMERCGHTQQELSALVGKSRTAVANVLRLLTLPEKIRQMIRAGQLTEGHARAIMQITDEHEQMLMADRIASEAMSVRAVEGEIRTPKRPRGRPAGRRNNPFLSDAESALKEIFATNVRLHNGGKVGRIEIEYYGLDDLTRLMELFAKLR